MPHAVVVPRWTGNASVPHASRASDAIEHVAEDIFCRVPATVLYMQLFLGYWALGVLHCCVPGAVNTLRMTRRVAPAFRRNSVPVLSSTAAMMWSST
jgi:predicted metal-dependent hydrolase